MGIISKIDNDFKQAMRDKEELKLSTLRMLKSAISNKSIDLKRQELAEADVLAVIAKELKKRQDSAQAFKDANRPDLWEKEEAEAKILQVYLPAQLAEAEVAQIVEKAVAKVGNNFGLVMKEVVGELKGRADGQLVQRLVKAKLGI